MILPDDVTQEDIDSAISYIKNGDEYPCKESEEKELLIRLFKICGGDPQEHGTNPHMMFGFIRAEIVRICEQVTA